MRAKNRLAGARHPVLEKDRPEGQAGEAHADVGEKSATGLHGKTPNPMATKRHKKHKKSQTDFHDQSGGWGIDGRSRLIRYFFMCSRRVPKLIRRPVSMRDDRR